MEPANPWRAVSVCAGRLALGASFAPTIAALGYAVGRSYGAATAMLLPCGLTFALASFAIVVAALAGGRQGGAAGSGLLVYALGSLFGQFALAVAVASAWTAHEPGQGNEPRRSGVRLREGAKLDVRPNPRYP